MTEIQVETIIEELTLEQDRLKQRLTALKAELSKIDSALSRVNGALNALRGNSKKKSIRRPAANKQDVIKLMSIVLQEQPLLSIAALKREVESRLSASGKNRMGLALRFKEALQESQFVETVDGIQLAEDLPPELLHA